jgi:hypothetical protein
MRNHTGKNTETKMNEEGSIPLQAFILEEDGKNETDKTVKRKNKTQEKHERHFLWREEPRQKSDQEVLKKETKVQGHTKEKGAEKRTAIQEVAVQ